MLNQDYIPGPNMKKKLPLFPAVLTHGDNSLFINVLFKLCFQAPDQNQKKRKEWVNQGHLHSCPLISW